MRHQTTLLVMVTVFSVALINCSDDEGGGSVTTSNGTADAGQDTSMETTDSGNANMDTGTSGTGGNEDTDMPPDDTGDSPDTSMPTADPAPRASPSSGGSSQLNSQRYKMKLSIGGPAPMGNTQSGQYRARIGVGAPQ